jgi:hypothetical protein
MEPNKTIEIQDELKKQEYKRHPELSHPSWLQRVPQKIRDVHKKLQTQIQRETPTDFTEAYWDLHRKNLPEDFNKADKTFRETITSLITNENVSSSEARSKAWISLPDESRNILLKGGGQQSTQDYYTNISGSAKGYEERKGWEETKAIKTELNKITDKAKELHNQFKKTEFQTPADFDKAKEKIINYHNAWQEKAKGLPEEEQPAGFFGIPDYQEWLDGKRENLIWRKEKEIRNEVRTNLNKISEPATPLHRKIRDGEFKTIEEHREAQRQLLEYDSRWSEAQKNLPKDDTPSNFFGIKNYKDYLQDKEKTFMKGLEIKRSKELSAGTSSYLDARRKWIDDPSEANKKAMVDSWDSLTNEHKKNFKEKTGYDIQTPERFTKFRQNYTGGDKASSQKLIYRRAPVRQTISVRYAGSPSTMKSTSYPSRAYVAGRLTSRDTTRVRMFIDRPSMRTLAYLPRPVLQSMYRERPKLVDLAWNYGYTNTLRQLANTASIILNKYQQEGMKRQRI